MNFGRNFSSEALAHLPPLAGRLERLTLRYVVLDDEDLATIACLSRLTSLDTGGDIRGEVTDAGLGALSALTALRALKHGLGMGGVTDVGLDHLLACTSLRRLSLDLGFDHATTPAGVQRVKAHPATQYLRNYDWDEEVFERIPLQDGEDRRDWD
jgi:hypothetical protein